MRHIETILWVIVGLWFTSMLLVHPIETITFAIVFGAIYRIQASV